MAKYQVTLTEVQRNILDLWKQGKPGSHIAHELNMTRSAVMGQLNRLRIKGHIPYKLKARQKNETLSDEIIPSIRIAQTATPKPPSPPSPAPSVTELIMAEVIKKIVHVKKDGRRIPLTALSRRSCRYPVAGNLPADFLFCGDVAMDGKPYCKEHYALCYVPRSTSKVIQAIATNFRRKHGPNNP
jgi:GcrA cell cycle regulator